MIYVFGAILLVAAASMLRGDSHAAPREPRLLRVLRRVLPVDTRLHGQRFVVRDGAACSPPRYWWPCSSWRPPM